MSHKISYKSFIPIVVALGLFVLCNQTVLATSVSRMFLTNLEGYPGQTINQEIILEGTDPGERSGFWYTHYKKDDFDNRKMDITSWITVNPKDFTIKEKEVKVFNVAIKIPKDAEPGLWGAVSADAGREGYSAERRTYIIFKDSIGGGNVYSGLLIPVSVNVLPSPDYYTRVINFVSQNLTIVLMSSIILILAAALIFVLLFNKSKLSKNNGQRKNKN